MCRRVESEVQGWSGAGSARDGRGFGWRTVGPAVEARREGRTILRAVRVNLARLARLTALRLAGPGARGVLCCGLGGAIVVAGGCSTKISRRDEYYLIHSLTFQPRAGDGSTIVVGHEQELLREVAGAGQVPMRGIDLDR